MKKLIIIGGGFAGSRIAKKLESKFDTTLIDTKDYYEFTPSILRTIVYPSKINKIQVLHSNYLKRSNIIIEEVKEISKNFVKTRNKKIEYDYLVISSGSEYSSPIKQKNVVISSRAEILKKHFKELHSSNKVTIIGGGLVGVEMATEIYSKYPKKHITIIDSNKEILPRIHKKSREYILKFLKKRKINLITNKIVNSKTKIDSDIIFICTGIEPHSSFLKKNFSLTLDNKKHVKVNDYLQVKNSPNIFAAGDITSIKEEKTAQNAERQADIVIKNIQSLENKKNLVKYKSKKTPLVISLGSYDGVLEGRKFVLKGVLPGFLKKLIEFKTLIKYKT